MSAASLPVNPEVLANVWNDIGQAQFAYQAVFRSELGQKVLADLLEFTNFMGDPFIAESQRLTDYMLGQHRLMKRILKFIEMDALELRRMANMLAAQRSYDPLANE